MIDIISKVAVMEVQIIDSHLEMKMDSCSVQWNKITNRALTTTTTILSEVATIKVWTKFAATTFHKTLTLLNPGTIIYHTCKIIVWVSNFSKTLRQALILMGLSKRFKCRKVLIKR